MTHANEPESALTQATDGIRAPQDQQRNRVVEFLVCACVVAIVFAAVMLRGYSEELGHWRLAAATELRLNGNLAGAIEKLDEALRQHPDHVELHLQRAAWNHELGNYEAALRDYDNVQNIAHNDPRMLLARAATNQVLGKPDESLRDIDMILDSSRGMNRAAALNTLAYFLAINDRELEKASTAIDEAIDLVTRPTLLFKSGGAPSALLDTRGFIRFKLGDLEGAKSDLELAVRGYSAEISQRYGSEREDMLGILDPRIHKLQLHSAQQSLAVVVYHRGLIYQKLGETALADTDFDKVRQLGFEPNDDLF